MLEKASVLKILSLLVFLSFINAGAAQGLSDNQIERFRPANALRQLAQAGARLAPGTDLGAVAARSAEGATLSLAAGSYPGFIRVSGKTLTINGDPGGGTVLTGSQSAIYTNG